MPFFSRIKSKLLEGLTWKSLCFIVLGAAIATFGIHNIHQRTGITEGGVIGAMLLVEHWLGFSPAYITPGRAGRLVRGCGRGAHCAAGRLFRRG